MLALTISSLAYVLLAKNRIITEFNVIIYVLLIISFVFMTALSSYDLAKTEEETTHKVEIISDWLYAGQYVFQWLSLLIFTLQY